ncbi:sodium-dependent bicarbonate transport family permease [Pseudomarimonas arenosa]|uniref:Sodium-dependent bicarbonate transport family permease n=1 Tax=Pseudomarimonas arenosa TaxID=2774145 RepID=A0AAW3ZTV5_9GAMM|nr:sodium-dependent bicarbonate transport family permease [Pseudomarimonas arenosa]MBD8527531.1 sodium-dependent bicarbonate transport family permease [Pseudomarimonas arenosa]
MLNAELLTANLLSPVVLAFLLGAIARAVRSDLEIPTAIQAYLSIFLLLAIGLKGGVALLSVPFTSIVVLLAVTIIAGLLTAGSAFAAARGLLGESRVQAAALAAHYGSVSAVTFIAAQQFTERSGTPADGYLVALVVALEIPAILLGLSLAKGSDGHGWERLREVASGKTAILLIGGLAIGAIAGKDRISAVDAMYFQLFQGTLMLFMLDMGMLAASQIKALGQRFLALLLFATALPLLHGLFGVAIGYWLEMSVANTTVFATMLASASYIAAPASIRAALPEANVGRCISAALGITFPFNLAIGIPVYATCAQLLVD